eukprot:89556_1
MSSLSRVFYLAVALLFASVVNGYDYNTCLRRIKLHVSYNDSVSGVYPYASMYINGDYFNGDLALKTVTKSVSSLEVTYLDNEYCVELNADDLITIYLWNNMLANDIVCGIQGLITNIDLGLTQQSCTDIDNNINYMDLYVGAQKTVDDLELVGTAIDFEFGGTLTSCKIKCEANSNCNYLSYGQISGNTGNMCRIYDVFDSQIYNANAVSISYVAGGGIETQMTHTMEPTVDPTRPDPIHPTIEPSQPTAEPTVNPLGEDIPLHQQWDTVGYVIVGFLFITPAILLLIGLWFHHKKTGTDSPNYFAVISCFTNIADFFTDNIFWIKLIVDDNVELAVFAAIFTLLPHILSIMNCLYHIQKWRKMKIEYIANNDNLIIALTVLAGFYPTIDFLSSKIFHRNQTSFHLTKVQVASLKQYRFFNNILLENVPLMILQIYTLIVVNKSKDIDPITMIALLFSTLSLFVGLLTLISRTFGNRSQETKSNIVCYSISLKANSFKSKHKYIHKTFSKLLSKCLEIHQHRVETVQVLETGYGVTLKVNILLQTTEEEEKIHKMMEKIQIEASDNGKNLNYLHRQLTFSSLFKSLLAKKLELDDLTDLVVIILKLNGSDNLPTDTVMMEEIIKTNKQQNEIEVGMANTNKVEMDNMDETERN